MTEIEADGRETDDDFVCPPLAGLVVYRAEIDTADDDAARNAVLDHIASLGVTAVELVAPPAAAEPSDQYVPAHVSLERAFGGAAALRRFIAEAHRRRLAVVLEVVYQQLHPAQAPDLNEETVRTVIVREALRWVRDTRVDGFRHDLGPYADLVDASGLDRSAGWQLMRAMNEALRDAYLDIVLVAADEQGHGHPEITSPDASGALFHTQWDEQFAHPVREALFGARPMADVRDAIGSSFGDTFSRVVYTDCCGLSGPDAGPLGWEAAKRLTLGLGLVLTSPGIPMLFQGQESMTKDAAWADLVDQGHTTGVTDLVRDLVRLRRNWYDTTRGLSSHGLDVFHCDETTRVVAWRRWHDGGPGDDVVVVANFSDQPRAGYRVGMPDDGAWRVRFSSDAATYSPLFGNQLTPDVVADLTPKDGQPASGEVSVGPYSLVVLSQDR